MLAVYLLLGRERLNCACLISTYTFLHKIIYLCIHVNMMDLLTNGLHWLWQSVFPYFKRESAMIGKKILLMELPSLHASPDS